MTDIVPADPDDPRGSGPISGFLPLLMTAIAVGAVPTLFVTSKQGRIVGVLGLSLLSGLAGAALGGSYLANAAVVGLPAAAVSGIITGFGNLLGAPGIGVGALLGFVLGNPISALTSAPEMLPQPWGQIGQFLPPGVLAQAGRPRADALEVRWVRHFRSESSWRFGLFCRWRSGRLVAVCLVVGFVLVRE